MKLHVIHILVGILCIGLFPNAQAVVPPPDGGYPGGNTAEGQAALLSRTTGGFNTAVGYLSLRSDTGGSYNTALGAGTLFANTADQNTATGAGALLSNTTGFENMANGAFALFSNTTGYDNTANGAFALFSNTEGVANTATGDGALFNNTSGVGNTAAGASALLINTTGYENTATGASALYNNTTGYENTATGVDALFNNTTGYNNTANGYEALFHNTSGIDNTAIGLNALEGNTTGGSNTAIGYAAGAFVTGDFNVCIGAGTYGVAGEEFTTRISNIGVTAQDTGIYVTLDTVGGTKLGYVNVTSSRRFKEDIKPMGAASEGLFALKPVNFRYKPDFDPDRSERFGLIAEDVEKVNPTLVAHDEKGNLTTVRYEAVNVMLLNEFLKEHRAFVEEQRKGQEQAASITALKATVAGQQKRMEAVTARLDEQAAQIQKVSARIESSRLGLQAVFNNQ